MSNKEKLIAFFEALTPEQLDYLAGCYNEIKALFELAEQGN